MRTELEQLEYDDALVAFNSIIEQFGARQVLLDYKNAYPEQYKELHTQINRNSPPNQIAALLR